MKGNTVVNSNSRPLLPSDEEVLTKKLEGQYKNKVRIQSTVKHVNDKEISPHKRSTSNINLYNPDVLVPGKGERALTDTNNFIQMYNKQHKLQNLNDLSQESIIESNEYNLSENNSDGQGSVNNDSEAISLGSIEVSDIKNTSVNEEVVDEDQITEDEDSSSDLSDPEQLKMRKKYEQAKKLSSNEPSNKKESHLDEEMSLSDKLKSQREKWAERGAAKIVRNVADPKTGEITKQTISKGINDFKFGEVIGDGSYSTVMLATSIESNQKYAVKVLNKEYLIRQKKVKYVNVEKNTLQRLNNSRTVVKLFFTFQDEAHLYFLLEYAPNGDFLSVMKKYGTLNEECACYYGAQIIDAIHFIHSKGIIHRDIKPENILLDGDMKVKLTDFGTAKILDPVTKVNNNNSKTATFDLLTRSKSFVGTAEYVTPELLNDSYTDYRCDIWAFGCILFQMIAGKPPFKATNEYLTFQKVMKVQYAFTAGFPVVIRDLVKKILLKQPSQRLTISAIKAHHFFNDKNFSDGSIWDDNPPEIQPYKINAKSMQPVPELKTTPGKRHLLSIPKRPSSRPNYVPSTPVSSAKSSTSDISTKNTKTSSEKTSSTNVYQYKKSIWCETFKRCSISSISSVGEKATPSISGHKIKSRVNSSNSTKSNLTSKSSQIAPEKSKPHGIPKSPSTPVLNNYMRSSNTTPVSSPGSRILSSNEETRPLNSTIESAMELTQFLIDPQEKIIKEGDIYLTVMDSNTLEKRVHKSRGHILDPQSFGAARTTLLSQAARSGGVAGLRNESNPINLSENRYYIDHSCDLKTIAADYKIPGGSLYIKEEDNSISGSKSPSPSINMDERGFGKFKKLFHKQDHSNEPIFMELSYKRKFVLTSYGRLLILAKNVDDESHSNGVYQLMTNILLSQTGLKIKELVIPSEIENGYLNLGAIITPFKSFVFCCTKQDTSSWFINFRNSIKMNHDRMVLLSSSKSNTARDNTPSLTPSVSGTKEKSESSTTTSLDPGMKSPKIVTPTPHKSYANTPPSPGSPRVGRPNRLFDSFVSSREKSKKNINPVPASTKLANGLPIKSDHSFVGLGLSSLQSKISRHNTPHPSTSSFTRTSNNGKRSSTPTPTSTALGEKTLR
ncbi:hypothetical protein TPHA_0P01050 [Tetrapisispora phaffii CBS 4417]|uniref:non-specific serine/threonine protein kinase n=1 Tax=Tetrapisispora phaffii (strain ATCC 24235 / CBS 4417 / NBRC 1672 / NRRL Y-8282 / UCD 70-5) TaxID=1071381 RepID=G8C285_TETPH|nr:hypothetical protein TPHA_0P01050 [Tetrapisispora phaffii CBS 4417]CCE66263.1 hypothetical protein TPHA_0P01050 [Tetrapisispora phaffii CBS 4417]